MHARVYTLYAALFGMALLLLGVVLQVAFGAAPASGLVARLGHAQSQPITWALEAAPFVLALVGHLAGRREDARRALEESKRDQLGATARELFIGAQSLLSSVSSFSSMTTQTAATVRETTSTMEQLGRTAVQAAVSAETVVGLARASKKSSEDGLQEIKVSISELVKLSEDVRGLAKCLEGINGRMRNIFEIASVMNYLGERFQSLADSAASELGQAEGQALPLGLRFIVAEMRRQGKDAKSGATLVQNIVNDMQKAMSATAAAAEVGVRRAERSAQIASRTGENIKKMSAALLNSSEAAMEIATLAKRQDQVIEDVLKSMNQAYLATEEAVASTQRVTEEAKGLNELATRLDGSVRMNGALPPPSRRAALLRVGGRG